MPKMLDQQIQTLRKEVEIIKRVTSSTAQITVTAEWVEGLSKLLDFVETELFTDDELWVLYTALAQSSYSFAVVELGNKLLKMRERRMRDGIV